MHYKVSMADGYSAAEATKINKRAAEMTAEALEQALFECSCRIKKDWLEANTLYCAVGRRARAGYGAGKYYPSYSAALEASAKIGFGWAGKYADAAEALAALEAEAKEEDAKEAAKWFNAYLAAGFREGGRTPEEENIVRKNEEENIRRRKKRLCLTYGLKKGTEIFETNKAAGANGYVYNPPKRKS